MQWAKYVPLLGRRLVVSLSPVEETKKILPLSSVGIKGKKGEGHILYLTGQVEPSRLGLWVLCSCRGNKCTSFFNALACSGFE